MSLRHKAMESQLKPTRTANKQSCYVCQELLWRHTKSEDVWNVVLYFSSNTERKWLGLLKSKCVLPLITAINPRVFARTPIRPLWPIHFPPSPSGEPHHVGISSASMPTVCVGVAYIFCAHLSVVTSSVGVTLRAQQKGRVVLQGFAAAPPTARSRCDGLAFSAPPTSSHPSLQLELRPLLSSSPPSAVINHSVNQIGSSDIFQTPISAHLPSARTAAAACTLLFCKLRWCWIGHDGTCVE